jgi:hypothetical protein
LFNAHYPTSGRSRRLGNRRTRLRSIGHPIEDRAGLQFRCLMIQASIQILMIILTATNLPATFHYLTKPRTTRELRRHPPQKVVQSFSSLRIAVQVICLTTPTQNYPRAPRSLCRARQSFELHLFVALATRESRKHETSLGNSDRGGYLIRLSLADACGLSEDGERDVHGGIITWSRSQVLTSMSSISVSSVELARASLSV